MSLMEDIEEGPKAAVTRQVPVPTRDVAAPAPAQTREVSAPTREAGVMAAEDAMSHTTGAFQFLAVDRFVLDASYLTDQGKVRPINEDCACVVIPDDPAVLDRKGMLVVVADGMGGHEGGEYASRMTVESLRTHYYEVNADTQSALVGALNQANEEVFKYSRKHPHLTGMGTTCTAIAIVGGNVWLVHVGDTRLYLIREGSAYRMTQDHSATMDMVKRGLLTLDEADHHEERNVILRAVGTRDHVEATTWKDPFPVHPGDRLLIGSDGFYETVPDEEIGQICSQAPGSMEACQALLKVALERDGNDNITVAVVCVTAEGHTAGKGAGTTAGKTEA